MAKNSVTLRLGSEGADAIKQKLREIGEASNENFGKAGAAAEFAGKKFDSTLARLDPLEKANRDLASAIAVAETAVKSGAKTQEEANKVIDLATARHDALIERLQRTSAAAKESSASVDGIISRLSEWQSTQASMIGRLDAWTAAIRRLNEEANKPLAATSPMAAAMGQHYRETTSFSGRLSSWQAEQARVEDLRNRPPSPIAAAMGTYYAQSTSMIGRLDAWTESVRRLNAEANKPLAPTSPLAAAMGEHYRQTTSFSGRLSAWQADQARAEAERNKPASPIAAAMGAYYAETTSMVGRLDAWSAAQKRVTEETTAGAKTAGLARHEWINLSRQMQDVGVSLYGGQAPLTVLVQQGSQIADIFGSSRVGAAASMKEFVQTIGGVALHPITLIAAGAISAGLATMRWKEQTDALTVSLNGLGRASGLTIAGSGSIAERAATGANISNASARGMAAQFLGAGVPGTAVGGAIGIATDFGRKLGLSQEEAAKTLASAFADPAKGAEELASRLGLVSFAQREEIKQLQAVGDKSGASARLLDALAGQLDRMVDPTTRWQKMLDGIGKRMSDKFDEIAKGFEGPKSYKDSIGQIAEQARRAKEASDSKTQQREADLNRMRQDGALAAREASARTFAEREAIVVERARIETLRQTNDAVKASIAAENERAKMLAESARKVDDLARGSRDSLELARLSPFERRMREIDNSERDFRRENLPSGPMAASFDLAGEAARKLADALNGAAAGVSGNSAPAFVKNDLLGRIIRAEGTDKFGDPFNTSLGYLKSPKPLTGMTMAESLSWGDEVRRRMGMNSSAKGAFQIVNSTQRAAMKALGLGMGDPFSVDNQKRMASWIARTQGLEAWEGFKVRPERATRPVPQNDNVRGLDTRTSKAFADQREQARYEMIQKPLKDANDEIDRQRALLKAQTAAFGQSTEATARAAKEQELLNEYQRNGVPLTAQLRAEIAATAENYGRLAQETEAAQQRQREMVGAMDELRSVSKETLGSIVSDLAKGKSAAEAFGGALSRIGDKLLNKGVDSIVEQLLGQTGKAGGGLFGDLIGGALKFLPFEKGGVMTSGGPLPLKAYASGGVAYGPQLALFGEGRMPEAYVPLPDGRAIPVRMQAPSAANSNTGAGGLAGNQSGRTSGSGGHTFVFNLPGVTNSSDFMKSQGQITGGVARALQNAGRYL